MPDRPSSSPPPLPDEKPPRATTPPPVKGEGKKPDGTHAKPADADAKRERAAGDPSSVEPDKPKGAPPPDPRSILKPPPKPELFPLARPSDAFNSPPTPPSQRGGEMPPAGSRRDPSSRERREPPPDPYAALFTPRTPPRPAAPPLVDPVAVSVRETDPSRPPYDAPPEKPKRGLDNVSDAVRVESDAPIPPVMEAPFAGQGLNPVVTPTMLVDAPPAEPAAVPVDTAILVDDFEDEVAAEDEAEAVQTYASGNDPMFGYLLAMALSLGLTAINPANADLRYVVGSGALAVMGVGSWLLSGSPRIERERFGDLLWGAAFGLILGVPLLLAGGSALEATANLLFRAEIEGTIRALPAGTVLALIAFVFPLGETLFFRGMLQAGRTFWGAGLLASAWSILLLLPMMEIGRYPIVALIVATALIMMNLIYGYVRQRSGLASAWLCQILVNFIVLFLPYTN